MTNHLPVYAIRDDLEIESLLCFLTACSLKPDLNVLVYQLECAAL